MSTSMKQNHSGTRTGPEVKSTMYLLTEWEGRTGKYLARGQDVRTERRPDFGATILRSISILSYDHLVLKILKILFEPNYDAIT